MGDEPVDRLYLKHHTGAETKSIVVHLAVFVKGPVTEVMDMNLAEPFLFRPLDNRVVERRLQQLRTTGYNIYTHNFQFSPFNSHGTGSYPLPPQGWHLRIRLTPSHPPLNTPYLSTASTIYWLQVGVNRQDGGVKGDMQAR